METDNSFCEYDFEYLTILYKSMRCFSFTKAKTENDCRLFESELVVSIFDFSLSMETGKKYRFFVEIFVMF